MLPFDPFDQFIELDRLLRGGQRVGIRKSVFAGGFIRSGGGSGHAGHWRCSASAGIGCGASGLAAHAPSKSASGGKARFIIMFGPFVDDALLRGDPGDVGLVGGVCGVGRGAVTGEGGSERRLFLIVKLLEPAALRLPMAGLAFLDEEQDAERERDHDPRHALRTEEAKQAHAPRLSASTVAPSRVASTLKRPTGPPASSPTMTTTMAAMKPASDQPKMVTIVCSSARLQPPHMRSAINATADTPQ